MNYQGYLLVRLHLLEMLLVDYDKIVKLRLEPHGFIKPSALSSVMFLLNASEYDSPVERTRLRKML